MANTKDGKLGVMCKQCRKVLDHPAAAHIGILSMNKHRKGVNVKNTSCQASPVGQEGILMGEEQRIGILYAETNPCQAQVLLSG